MKKQPTTNELVAAAPVEKHIEGLADACGTAAYKINVVIGVLHTAENSDGDDGGYGLCIAMDILEEIRDALRESLHAEGARQRDAATAGGVK